MMTRLHLTSGKLFSCLFAGLLAVMQISNVNGQCTGYPTLKAERITNINVAGGYYNGLMRWLPADYATQPTKKYPLLVYFHGAGAVGDGSATALCNILTDQTTTLPNRIENNQWDGTSPSPSGTMSFIVIAPQYTGYASPFLYANQTEQLINYLIANYRVDETRIYLTGMSTGANMVMDYLSSDANRAKRIAAASFASLCFPTNLSSAGATQGPANVATGGVATWFTHCVTESDTYCGINTPTGWVNGINANTPARAPRFSQFQVNNVGAFGDAALNYCQGFAHDTWSAMYYQNFAPLDGGPDFYEWALQYQNLDATLPVNLKSFTARLSNGKVYLRWVTSVEQDNATFTIERSANSQQFTAIKTIQGAGQSAGEKVYEYVDEQPLSNLSFYRLQQTDGNGRSRYFDIRKVMNKPGGKTLLAAAPNPFIHELTAFITVTRTQKVDLVLTDINGKRLAVVNGSYSPGTTAVDIPATGLTRGVYFLRASGEGVSATYKVIKQ